MTPEAPTTEAAWEALETSIPRYSPTEAIKRNRPLIEAAIRAESSAEIERLLPEKPPVKWATIREDASERGLFAVVDEAMIGRKLMPSRRRLIVGNIVMAVAKWRESFRDCGCWKTADGYALCRWHEAMLQSQVEPLRAALAPADAAGREDEA